MLMYFDNGYFGAKVDLSTLFLTLEKSVIIIRSGNFLYKRFPFLVDKNASFADMSTISAKSLYLMKIKKFGDKCLL